MKLITDGSSTPPRFAAMATPPAAHSCMRGVLE